MLPHNGGHWTIFTSCIWFGSEGVFVEFLTLFTAEWAQFAFSVGIVFAFTDVCLPCRLNSCADGFGKLVLELVLERVATKSCTG